MKKLIFFLFVLPVIVSCGNNPRRQGIDDTPQEDRVELFAFHGRQRCVTCRAIEDLSREVVETDFAEQLADGALVFRIVDITDPANEALAGKYEVAWSSLVLIRWRNGKETVDNLTEFAFADARSNPEKFRAGLKAEIEKQLAR